MIDKQHLMRIMSNPMEVEGYILDQLEQHTDQSLVVPDVNNPLAFFIGSSVAMGSAIMDSMSTILRRHYPELAQTEEDLYYHMSDVDYLNRFASPSWLTISLLFRVDEIHEVAVEDGGGVKKVRIPKDTAFTIDGTVFTMQYPIDIRVLPHGGLQVVYDNDIMSPLYTLESNTVDWELIDIDSDDPRLGKEKVLYMNINVKQFDITSHRGQAMKGTPFNASYTFDDQYYYTRVWHKGEDTNQWVELTTTHSDVNYDVRKPTAILKVVGNELSVSIPQIYFTSELINRSIRVDIHTTQGEINRSFERYEPKDWSGVWKNLTEINDSAENAFRSLRNMTIFSPNQTIGGQTEVEFETLRNRIIYNTVGEINTPITPSQLNAFMDTRGYAVSQVIDNVTNRIYKATRPFSKPTGTDLRTAIGSNVVTYRTSMDSIRNSVNVYDNNQRLLLRSGTLFDISSGLLKMLSDSERIQLTQSSNAVKAALLNNGSFAFTVFDYVLDRTTSGFEFRPYSLDDPLIINKTFINDNPTTLLTITTVSNAINRVNTGYRLVVQAQTDDFTKSLPISQIHPRLSYRPKREADDAFLNASDVQRDADGNLIVTFDIYTTFDIDTDNHIKLDNFSMYEETPVGTLSDLTQTFNLFYLVSEHEVGDMVRSDIDGEAGTINLPANTIGVTHERIKLEFGQSLDGLWSRSKSIISAIDYVKHLYDVYETYQENLPKRDAEGNIEFYINSDGHITYDIAHRKGDFILDVNGQRIIKHRKGDWVRDPSTGEPYVDKDREIEHQLDVFVLDAKFMLSDDKKMRDYVMTIRRQMVDWIQRDIASIKDRLLENTFIWYHPNTTIGAIDVIADDNRLTKINSEQSFNVKLYVSESAYNNNNLRTELASMCVDTIASALGKRRISVMTIAEGIKASGGVDVIDAKVSGLGGSDEYTVITLKDDSHYATIKKRPVLLKDGSLSVEEDVVVEFIRHV